MSISACVLSKYSHQAPTLRDRGGIILSLGNRQEKEQGYIFAKNIPPLYGEELKMNISKKKIQTGPIFLPFLPLFALFPKGRKKGYSKIKGLIWGKTISSSGGHGGKLFKSKIYTLASSIIITVGVGVGY